jgi:hypothetical protein
VGGQAGIGRIHLAAEKDISATQHVRIAVAFEQEHLQPVRVSRSMTTVAAARGGAVTTSEFSSMVLSDR